MWLRWVKGRLNTGYDKLLIFQSPMLMTDCWLIRMRPLQVIPPHIDPVDGYRHYRLNIILVVAELGGEFNAFWSILDWPRLKLFRSDFPHSVSKVWSGNRVVLSFGLCLRDKR